MKPLQLTLLSRFDENKHNVDNTATKYLEKASKSVQKLIPVKTLEDGNCLFNSIVSLTPDSGISATELRGSSYFPYSY